MKIEWKTCLRICVSIFLLFLCINYWEAVATLTGRLFSALLPLLSGAVIAYLVNILMTFYERHYFPNKTTRPFRVTRRPVCMAGAFLTLIAIILLVISLVLPQFISCIQVILSELPDAIDFIVAHADGLNILPENIISFLSTTDWQSRIGEIFEVFSSGVGNFMGVAFKTVSSVFSAIITTLLSLIFSIYLLANKDKLKAQFIRLTRNYLPSKIYEKIFYVSEILNDCFRKYITGQCTEAVILGILCTLGMLILHLPYATMIGALIAFTALIPVAGAYIGAGVGAFMLLTSSPIQALIFLIFIVVLQQLEGNLIYPKVVGSSLGLPAIWVLAAVTVGGGLFGVAGMLIGVPVAAAVYRIIKDDIKMVL